MEDTSGYRNIKTQYKIEGTLGKGSFATVKKAKNRTTGVRYAVKVLSKRKMNDEEKIAIQTEIEILKSVDHPNIVKLIDVFEDERHWCLVMELMEGGELFDEILEKEFFNENEARESVRAIIEAIDYCHNQGIVHRDIKPENLLLQNKQTGITSLKIADFGLARLLQEESFASTTCGTPGYVAPEVLMQKPYGKACDAWSIGVVAFILLSGTPPFYEENNFELFEQIKNCKYDFDVETWENVSEEAKDFIRRVLVADPGVRLTCAEMLLHPWFTKVISSDVKLNYAKSALMKYVSIRKEKSQKIKKETNKEGDSD